MERGSGSDIARSTLAYLRQNIASGAWPINSRIPKEPELMDILGVGKSTVREAVRTLANLGMLETLAGRGTFVRSRAPVSSVLTEFVADYDVEDILIYRRALEIEAAQQAAANRTGAQLDALRAALEIDRPAGPDVDYPPRFERGRTPGQFHFLIFEATGSRLLPGLYAGVMAALRSEIDHQHVIYGASADLRRLDHAAILSAIEDQDAARAGRAMALHVDRDLVPDDGDIDPPRPAPTGELPADRAGTPLR